MPLRLRTATAAAVQLSDVAVQTCVVHRPPFLDLWGPRTFRWTNQLCPCVGTMSLAQLSVSVQRTMNRSIVRPWEMICGRRVAPEKERDQESSLRSTSRILRTFCTVLLLVQEERQTPCCSSKRRAFQGIVYQANGISRYGRSIEFLVGRAHRSA